MPEDPHQLEHFLVAQEGIYEQALAKLRDSDTCFFGQAETPLLCSGSL